MGSGILAGVFWALGTVLLGKAMTLPPFDTAQAAFLTPFVCTFLHDLCSALWATGGNALRGELPAVYRTWRSRDGRIVMLAALLGGPVGMTGYVLAVRSMGASVGAVASAAFPAVGAVLAVIFLKEKMQWYRWLFLLMTLGGVYALSFSPSLAVQNFRLGVLGVLLCSCGWGAEAVVLSKCLKNGVRGSHALQIRQTTSAVCYGAVLLPALRGWGLTVRVFSSGAFLCPLLILLAGLCATLSYSFYYRAIRAVGASRAMALDVTYAAWALPFSALVYRDAGVFQARTVVCMVVVLVCGVLTAAKFRQRRTIHGSRLA